MKCVLCHLLGESMRGEPMLVQGTSVCGAHFTFIPGSKELERAVHQVVQRRKRDEEVTRKTVT